MTVGSQVKNCYSSIKGIEASLEILANKTQTKETEQALIQAKNMMKEIKTDLQQQLIFLTQEEPQYKQ